MQANALDYITLIWLSGVFCTVRDYGTLCLDCFVTLATTLLALHIL